MEKQIFEEQQEQTNEVSFEELCPEWNEIIKSVGGFDNLSVDQIQDMGKKRNLQDYKCCVVGEAFALQ